MASARPETQVMDLLRARRALRLLAANRPRGMTEEMLLEHGVSAAVLVDLVAAGLATIKADQTKGRQPSVMRVRITDAGRRVLIRGLVS
jgi:hypothetical protein